MENELKFNLYEMGFKDIESMKLIIDAWYNLDDRDIMYEGTGFNKMSGYVYIALENGISICSCFGQEVEYLVTDFETGEEYFYETYEEALNKLETL
jgi:hypothetical protein|tara:strand:+ start:4647 stop:4934 length:288 start_codon:yes stop_codon:yes gene_type:complete